VTVPQERTFDVLHRILSCDARDRLTIGDFIDGLGDRAFGILILLFALPNCIPGPPGLSTITGIPVVIFAWQMMVGAPRPKLPQFLRDRSFPRKDVLSVLNKAEKYFRKIERVSRPRLVNLMSDRGERIMGIVLLVLAVVMTIPIPFGNLWPAVAIAVIALAVMEHDGVTLIVGYVLGVMSLILAATGVLLTFAAIGLVFSRIAD